MPNIQESPWVLSKFLYEKVAEGEGVGEEMNSNNESLTNPNDDNLIESFAIFGRKGRF